MQVATSRPKEDIYSSKLRTPNARLRRRVNPLIYLDARDFKVLHRLIFFESISGVTKRIFVVGSSISPDIRQIHAVTEW